MFKKLTPSIIFACATLLVFPSHGYCDPSYLAHTTQATTPSTDSQLYPILDVTFPPQYTILSDQWKKTMNEKNHISSMNSDHHLLDFQRKYHILTQKQYNTFTKKFQSCQTAMIVSSCELKIGKQEAKLTKNRKPPKNMQQAYNKERQQLNDLETKLLTQEARLYINEVMSDNLKYHKVTLSKAREIKEQENFYAENDPYSLPKLFIDVIEISLNCPNE